MPTADKARYEWYPVTRYQESEGGKPSRSLPFTELVYGLSDRQKITFEVAGLSVDHEYRLSDSILVTSFTSRRSPHERAEL